MMPSQATPPTGQPVPVQPPLTPFETRVIESLESITKAISTMNASLKTLAKTSDVVALNQKFDQLQRSVQTVISFSQNRK